MAVWDLACIWRRPLLFLARGLCACSLVVLYLFTSLVPYFGYRTARTAPPSRLQAPIGEGSTGSSLSSAAEESSAILEATLVGFDAPFGPHRRPRFATGQPLVLNSQESIRSLVVPRIVVQDFSAEDGSARYKTPEYDLTHAFKRRRRLSWARVSANPEDRLAVTTEPSFRLPHP